MSVSSIFLKGKLLKSKNFISNLDNISLAISDSINSIDDISFIVGFVPMELVDNLGTSGEIKMITTALKNFRQCIIYTNNATSIDLISSIYSIENNIIYKTNFTFGTGEYEFCGNTITEIVSVDGLTSHGIGEYISSEEELATLFQEDENSVYIYNGKYWHIIEGKYSKITIDGIETIGVNIKNFPICACFTYWKGTNQSDLEQFKFISEIPTSYKFRFSRVRDGKWMNLNLNSENLYKTITTNDSWETYTSEHLVVGTTSTTTNSLKDITVSI